MALTDLQLGTLPRSGHVGQRGDSPALLLPPEEVARLLSISPRKLRAMVSCGEFPRPARIGRLARYRRCDVEEWVSRLGDSVSN